MATKNVLGRGLGALIDSGDIESAKAVVDAISEVAIRDIEANPWQPRSKFDEEALVELAESIKSIGIIQPITVRILENGKFQLITGERRFRAAKMIGLNKIPAFVRLANDQNMLEMALVENIQREDLNSIEVAITYQRLIEECNLTQEQLSQKTGQDRSTVTNFLRLLKLPEPIHAALRDKKISMGHARALLSVSDPQIQAKILNDILKNELSVRRIEEYARNYSGKKKNPKCLLQTNFGYIRCSSTNY